VISLSARHASESGKGAIGAMFGDPSSVQAKVEAKVVLDQPSKMLIPGSLAVLRWSDQRQNVVAIPPEAVQQAGPNRLFG